MDDNRRCMTPKIHLSFGIKLKTSNFNDFKSKMKSPSAAATAAAVEAAARTAAWERQQ